MVAGRPRVRKAVYDRGDTLQYSRRERGVSRVGLLTTNHHRPTTVPMRIAYLDCFSGISGDMFLGALVDAGVSPKLLEDTVAALEIGARLEISRVVRGGISATKVDVYANGEKDLPREAFLKQQEHDHVHPHSREQG